MTSHNSPIPAGAALTACHASRGCGGFKFQQLQGILNDTRPEQVTTRTRDAIMAGIAEVLYRRVDHNGHPSPEPEPEPKERPPASVSELPEHLRNTSPGTPTTNGQRRPPVCSPRTTRPLLPSPEDHALTRHKGSKARRPCRPRRRSGCSRSPPEPSPSATHGGTDMTATTTSPNDLAARAAAAQAEADRLTAEAKSLAAQRDREAADLQERQQEPRRQAKLKVARDTLAALDSDPRHVKSRAAWEAAALDPNVGADKAARLWQAMRADEAMRAATVRGAADDILDTFDPQPDESGATRDGLGTYCARTGPGAALTAAATSWPTRLRGLSCGTACSSSASPTWPHRPGSASTTQPTWRPTSRCEGALSRDDSGSGRQRRGVGAVKACRLHTRTKAASESNGNSRADLPASAAPPTSFSPLNCETPGTVTLALPPGGSPPRGAAVHDRYHASVRSARTNRSRPKGTDR